MATTALAAPTAAQQHIESTIPPVFQSVDENGVDQISGQLVQTLTSLSIGPGGPGSITFNWANSNSGQSDVIGFVAPDTPTTGKYSVTLGGSTETFTYNAGTFSQDQGRGSTLTYDSATAHYTYTGADGRVAVFGQVNPGGASYILSLTYPAGQSLTYYYRLIPGTPTYPTSYYTLRSVVSNLGYQIHYDYGLAPSGTYYMNTGVVLFNRANEACDPNADSCSLTGNWPRLNFALPSSTEVDGTDNLGRLYRWINTQVPPDHTIPGTPGTSTMIFPTGRTLTFAINQWGQVTSANDGRGTWQYQRPNPMGGTTLTFYPEQNGPPRQIIFDPATGHITSEIHTLVTNSITTSYSWTNNRISAVSLSDGSTTQTTQYTYDARGNVTQIRRISATPGTPADIVTSAVYPATCTNLKTCNQPTSTTDALGRTTDYTYDPNTGATLSVTLPAGANGVRPQTLYGYAAYQAYYLNNAGSIVASGSNVTLPVSISSCITGAPGSCTGTADEARTTIAYGPQTPGVANNLLQVSTTSGNGNGALAATTAMTYTPNGDLETVDGPLEGSADTARTYYDAARRPTGAIGPDPDGSGALPRLASRTTYNGDNQPTTVESGTATDQSANGMSTFTSLQQRVTGYDAQGRATSVRLNAGGTTYSLTQSSTTLSGFPECSAVRMNPGTFASPPASACTPATAGADGPDRITRIAYDGYRRLPLTTTTGVGTALEAVETTTTYDSLNREATLKDGQNNLTTYAYDGFSRRISATFPSPTQGAGTSDSSNWEGYAYDAAGNLVQRRLRDARVLVYDYDNLNRPVMKRTWQIYVGITAQTNYAYDNLGRMTSASFPSGEGITNVFDALGRPTSTTSNMGGAARTLSYQYDLAGNRTQITHPDGNYFLYNYDVLGRLTLIRENGSNWLDGYSYNAPGALLSAQSYNGGSAGFSSYSYDAIGRPTAIGHASTVGAVNWSYDYNPASQLRSSTRDADGFAWTGHYNVNRVYANNGLNQHLSAGSTNFSYEANGNLITDGSNTYAYDAENRLISASGAHTASLAYDPLGRLWQVTSGSNITRFLYDGDALVAEYDGSGNLIRRHVHGPGIDTPVVTYEGATLSTRRFLYADERGSVAALADSGGVPVTINSYDEHGIPGAGNSGRFQYTGQAWLPELGMYYYKARMYSPTLGRFMQTDPIGYDAGMNMYNYVRSDPVNRVDPSGLFSVCFTVTTYDPGPYNNPGGSNPVDSSGAIVVTGHRPTVTQQCVDIPDEFDSNRQRPPTNWPPPEGPSGRPPTLLASALSRFVPQRGHDYCGSAAHNAPDQLPGVDLRPACARHDDCYATLGATKAFCDQQLGRDVFILCMNSTGMLGYCQTMAMSYYQGVYWGGQGPYDDAQRAARDARRH